MRNSSFRAGDEEEGAALKLAGRIRFEVRWRERWDPARGVAYKIRESYRVLQYWDDDTGWVDVPEVQEEQP